MTPHTPTPDPKPEPETLMDAATNLAVAIQQEEIATLIALQTLMHPVSLTRTDAEIEADFDNFPV